MDEDTLNDLKQFIAATVSQATAGVATKEDITAIRTEMATKQDVARLSDQIQDLDLKVDTIAETLNGQHSELVQRVARLEQQAASA